MFLKRVEGVDTSEDNSSLMIISFTFSFHTHGIINQNHQHKLLRFDK